MTSQIAVVSAAETAGLLPGHEAAHALDERTEDGADAASPDRGL